MGTTTMTSILPRIVAIVGLVSLSLVLASAQQADAQDAPAAGFSLPPLPPPTTGAAAAIPTAEDKPPLSQEELEQLVAPLALYPDSLLAQIFMASTYPVEIVQAERWMKANPTLKDAALTAGLEKEMWDPSVKSLVAFPPILTMMSEKLDITIKLGDAFIGQQKEVMDAVQKLRAKAKEQGNLQSNQQQTVTVEPAAAGTQTQTIIIQPADPQIVYVPQYNPTVVYGTWPYPTYAPYPYYPPGYAAAGAIVGFGVGLAVGAAWGYAWGNCNWGGGDVNINVNRNNNFNQNIDRSRYQNDFQNQRGDRAQNGSGTWQHDGSHRQGAPYRDSKSAQQFGGKSASEASKARDSYRGRAEAGQKDITRGGADNFKGNSPANRPANSNAGAGNARAKSNPGSSSATNRGSGSGSKGNAFSGSNKSGATARADSNRGSSSRSGGSYKPSGGQNRSSGGASRSGGGGGGGSRGGGGGGGGGRGGGGRR